MADFIDQDLTGSRFEHVDLSGSRWRTVDLSDADIRGADLRRVRMRGVELEDVAISGELKGVRINGVDVTDMVRAEVERQHPELARMRPTDPAGFREAWDLVEALWAQTVDRAKTLDPTLLHESVDEEWSFVQTLRHLVFATDAWVNRAILGDPAPWHPLGLPWDEAPELPGVSPDRDARPGLDEVLELRRARMDAVRRVVDGLNEESLAGDTTPPRPGWPPPEPLPVRERLLVVLNEECWHRIFAERDLAVLEARTRS
jgi:hypothetical protein